MPKKGGCTGKFELANNGTLFLDEIRGNQQLKCKLYSCGA
jgi:transcriptional regulator with PAS, ATPase and Fis domain